MKWNLEYDGWVGGHFPVRNSSGGYHGLEKQWWDFYIKDIENPRVLLVSEGKESKEDFQKAYPTWDIKTLELNGSSDSDLIMDICKGGFAYGFHLIICQATLEHLYDPYGAMQNMVSALNPKGILVIHTHSLAMAYHAWPRDYIRFMDDWWVDLSKHLSIELLEFYNLNQVHVFACYKKK